MFWFSELRWGYFIQILLTMIYFGHLLLRSRHFNFMLSFGDILRMSKDRPELSDTCDVCLPGIDERMIQGMDRGDNLRRYMALLE